MKSVIHNRGTMSEEQVLPESINLKHEVQFPGMAGLPYRVVYNGNSLMSICSDADKVVVAMPPEIPEGRHTYFQGDEREAKSMQFMVYAANRHHALTAALAQSEAERERLREARILDQEIIMAKCTELARERELHRWIEIKDGLPKYKQVVLLLCGDGAYQEVAVYRPDNPSHRWECHNGYKPQDITHWKPLTSPALLEDKSKPVATTAGDGQ